MPYFILSYASLCHHLCFSSLFFHLLLMTLYFWIFPGKSMLFPCFSSSSKWLAVLGRISARKFSNDLPALSLVCGILPNMTINFFLATNAKYFIYIIYYFIKIKYFILLNIILLFYYLISYFIRSDKCKITIYKKYMK